MLDGKVAVQISSWTFLPHLTVLTNAQMTTMKHVTRALQVEYSPSRKGLPLRGISPPQVSPHTVRLQTVNSSLLVLLRDLTPTQLGGHVHFFFIYGFSLFLAEFTLAKRSKVHHCRRLARYSFHCLLCCWSIIPSIDLTSAAG